MQEKFGRQPETFEFGVAYFLREPNGKKMDEDVRVVFLAYRPHPAELVVRYQGKKRLVSRRFLYELAELGSPGAE